MYEKNNTLTAAQVKNALTAGAGGTGDNQNGCGKINAVSTMGKFSTDTSGYSGTGNLDDDDGGGGSSGCGGTIAPAGPGTAGLGTMMLMLPGILIAIRRRKR